jgi:hypothetical protein
MLMWLAMILAVVGYLALAVQLDHERGLTVAEDLAGWGL